VVLDPNKVTLLERACSFLKIALIFSSALTVASIFTNYVPSFTRCSVVTLILGLAKSSAEQMSDRI
jgi:hypothetical protein